MLKLIAALCGVLMLPCLPAHASWYTMSYYTPFPSDATAIDVNLAPSMYACRATFEGGVHPGWTTPGKRACAFGWGGAEQDSSVYDIWVEDWEPDSNGNVPWNAIALGYEQARIPGGLSLQVPRYACRVYAPDNSLQTGKVAVDIGGCDYPWNGVEMHATSYNVLVDSAFTMIDNPGKEAVIASAADPALGASPGTGNYAGAVAGIYQSILYPAVPSDPVKSGEQTNGSPLYLCSASWLDGWHIGSTARATGGGCNISYGGREIANVAPYVMMSQHYVSTSGNGAYPVGQSLGSNVESTVIGGHEATGSNLYLCAGYVYGLTTMQDVYYMPGKLSRSLGGCSVAVNGKEMVIPNYVVMGEVYSIQTPFR